MPRASRQWHADALLLCATMIAAAGWIFSREALAGMPPIGFIGLRFLLAGLLLSAVAWPGLRRLSRSGLYRGLLVGLLFSVAIGFWVLGLAHSRHLGESAFINSLGILMVPVVALMLFGEKPPRPTWVALPVALAGFALLSLDSGFRLEAGQLLMLGSATCFALLINANIRVARHLPALPLTALQLLVVGVVLTPLSLWTEGVDYTLTPAVLGWFVASALPATALRFFLQVKGQSLTTPSHASVILMLEAVWTALFAALWFGESVTALQLGGCGLIFIALIINRWRWIAGAWHRSSTPSIG